MTTKAPSRREALKLAALATSVAASGSASAAECVSEQGAPPPPAATNLTAREAVDHIRKGDMTAEAYVGQLLAHHDAHKDLNVFITLDRARVLEEARAVDQARARGQKLGALAGLPVVIKDQIDVAGYPTTVGSTILKGYVAKKNAVVVDALVKNGAVIMAKTNMSDLITQSGGSGGGSGGRYYPIVRNPYDLSRVTGSSSTGVGAALGARIAPAGIGEDSAGSARYPAAMCGIAGMRPSTYTMDNYLNKTDRKRYPGLGLVPPAGWFDTMGPMARSASDVALLDTAITGEVPPKVDLRKVRIGIPRGDYWDDRPHDPPVRQTIEAAFAKLRDAGAQLIEVDLNGLINLSAKDRLGPALTKGARPLADWLAENLPNVTIADVEAERMRNRTDPPARNWLRAIAGPVVPPKLSAEEELAMIKAAATQYAAVFKDNGLAALAMPTILILAPIINFNGDTPGQKIWVNGARVEEWDLILTNIWWTSRFGAPALSLPAGLGSGLPVGLQFQGLPGADSALLGLGMAAESVLGPLPPPTFKHVPI